jgi:hypothetical protein
VESVPEIASFVAKKNLPEMISGLGIIPKSMTPETSDYHLQ